MSYNGIENLSHSPEELAYSFLLASAGFVLLRFLPLRGTSEEQLWVRRALLVALGVRWAAGVLIYYYAPYGAFAEDNWAYAKAGRMLAEYWAGAAGAQTPVLQSDLVYYAYNAVVFTLLGFAPLVVVTINCLAGAFAVWLAHRVAEDLMDGESGVYAAWLVALFPSLVLWSSMNLRDVWVLLGILAIVDALLSVYKNRWVAAVAAGAVGFGCVGLFRSYLVSLLLLGLIMGVVMSATRRLTASVMAGVLLFAGAVALSLYLGPVLSIDLVDEATLRELTMRRRSLAEGGSPYLKETEFRSLWDVVLFLPIGAVYFLLGPFPWAATGYRQLLTIPEVLFWYWLIPQTVRGARLALRRAASVTLILGCLTSSIAVPYILVSSNMGTAYRHRAQVLIILLVFAAIGLAGKRQASRRGVALAPDSGVYPAVAGTRHAAGVYTPGREGEAG